MKICTKCMRSLPLREFPRSTRHKSGHRNECVVCCRAYMSRYYKTNRARAIEEAQKWREKNRVKYLAWLREWGRKNYHRKDARHIQKRYGIRMDEYHAILKRQGGVCGCCGTNTPGKRFKRFSVDHDHITKEVRGVLCHRCNLGIGSLNDDLLTVLAAADYLRRHEERVAWGRGEVSA